MKCIFFSIFLLCIAQLQMLFSQEHSLNEMIKQGMWQGENIDYWAGDICLKIKPNVNLQFFKNYLASLGLRLALDFDKLRWGFIKVQQERNIFGLMDTLLQSPLVELVEPNGVMYATSVPNDSLFSKQWGMHNVGQIPPGGTINSDIDAPEAWNISQGDTSILIAVLDTGIPLGSSNQLSHPDLSDASKVILGPDMIDSVTQGQYPDPEPDPTVRDSSGHGTHVIGILAAETNNGIGVAGIANQCKILVIQVFCHKYVPSASSVEAFRRGVIYAVDHGATIINYSGGVGKRFNSLRDAVIYANNNDVIIVAAAGNDFNMPIRFPAAYSDSFSNVIAVGATDHNDQKAPFSNIGSELDVVAPGGYAPDTAKENWFDANDIISTIPSYIDHPGALTHGAWYGYAAGTSMATPLVAGVSALIRSYHPTWTASQVRERIRYSADDVNGYTHLGFDNYIGYGRINAYRALSGTPATPILSSPANNCTTAYNIATLIWHTATWATSYHLQVDDENTFTSPLIKDIQSITDTQWTDAYSPNSRYYWRVWAVNNSGSGDTSIIWSFITGPAPPSISLNWVASTLPTIKKPCGQSCNPTYSDCYPKLSWSFQNGAVGPCDIYRYHCPSEGGDCGGPAQLMVDNQSGTCWVDQGVIVIRPGQSPITTFYYYVVGNGGVGPQSNKVAVNTIMAWKIDDDFVINSIPATTQLIGNYPNPFNPTTTISYDLSEDVHVILKIYDILGREVMTLVNENQTAGRKSVELFAINLESGFYLYRLEAGKYTEMKKMLLIK